MYEAHAHGRQHLYHVAERFKVATGFAIFSPKNRFQTSVEVPALLARSALADIFVERKGAVALK